MYSTSRRRRSEISRFFELRASQNGVARLLSHPDQAASIGRHSFTVRPLPARAAPSGSAAPLRRSRLSPSLDAATAPQRRPRALRPPLSSRLAHAPAKRTAGFPIQWAPLSV